MHRLIWLLPLLLLALCWGTRPFAASLAEVKIPLGELSKPQVRNIRLASERLDQAVIQPGETFSFNKIVGPRNTMRGYVNAPSYLEGTSPQTLGGGICLLSSAVYQAALKAGLPITNRVPHLRAVRSVPPGLDATVWYGQADLAFVNNSAHPLRLESRLKEGQLHLSLRGAATASPHEVKRLIRPMGPKGLQVSVFRDGEMISRDLYRQN